MNRYKLTISLVILSIATFVVTGCKKLIDAKPLDGFSVVSDKPYYSIGDTVVFSINQDVDEIVFYSGKPGNNYNQIGRNFEPGTNILKFQTSLSQASKTNNGDTLLLKIATNLKSYDSAGIANANWEDLTSFAKWPAITTTGFVNSGSIDISKFNTADSVYIAFQVLGKQNAATQQRKWQVQNLTLSNLLADSTFTPLFAAPFTSAPNPTTDTVPYFQFVGWTQVNLKNNPLFSFINPNYNAWNVGDFGINALNAPIVINNKPCNLSGVAIQSAYPITFDPGPTSIKNNPDNEDWLITSPVNLKLVRHDFPTAVIKNYVNTPTKGMKYVKANGVYASYSFPIDASFKSGKTYDMVFVAQNTNLDQKKEIVKHVTIKIN